MIAILEDNPKSERTIGFSDQDIVEIYETSEEIQKELLSPDPRPLVTKLDSDISATMDHAAKTGTILGNGQWRRKSRLTEGRWTLDNQRLEIDQYNLS